MKIKNNYFVVNNGFMYGMSNVPYMATTCNENGKDLIFFINEEDGFDMFDQNIFDIFEEFDSSTLMFSINEFEPEVVNEATAIKLPLNSEKDLKGMSIEDRLKVIDKVPHIKLWVSPESYNKDKYSSCWIWVELPKSIDNVRYVPIIVHTAGGVSVHPYYHKYFLRSFDKRTRHLILGFCYVYGPNIAMVLHSAYKNHYEEVPDSDISWVKHKALRYRDNEAPKRINMGAEDKSEFFKPAYNDYVRWTNSLKG